MKQSFTEDTATVTVLRDPSVVPCGNRRNRSLMRMVTEEGPQVGQAYSSQRTGQKLIVLKIDGDRVYYSVEGFDPISPLFLPREKFVHLVGLDLKTP